MFKVGQKVWEFTMGWGAVTGIVEDGPYPIKVTFHTGATESYTDDGREFESCARVLFFNEFSAPEDALNPPIEHLALKYGDVILTDVRTILFVCQDSSPSKDTVRVLPSIPRGLDDEYEIYPILKKHVKKVIGNINDGED